MEGIERRSMITCVDVMVRYVERVRFGRKLVPYRGQERAAGWAKVRLTIDLALNKSSNRNRRRGDAVSTKNGVAIMVRWRRAKFCNRPN
jgi:hypothetical protein